MLVRADVELWEDKTNTRQCTFHEVWIDTNRASQQIGPAIFNTRLTTYQLNRMKDATSARLVIPDMGCVDIDETEFKECAEWIKYIAFPASASNGPPSPSGNSRKTRCKQR